MPRSDFRDSTGAEARLLEAGCITASDAADKARSKSAFSFHDAWRGLAARLSDFYMTGRLQTLRHVMRGHTVRWVWSKVRVLQLSDLVGWPATGPWGPGKS